MAGVMIGVDPHKASHTAVAISGAEERLGEQLLEVGGRERVVRGLGELRLTGLRLERADVADVAAGRSNVVPDPGWGLPVISLRRAAACVRGDLLGCRHELRTST